MACFGGRLFLAIRTAARLAMIFGIVWRAVGTADTPSRGYILKPSFRFRDSVRFRVRDLVMCNQSSDPAFFSGTSRAVHEPRHP